jgi:hypothetical protein
MDIVTVIGSLTSIIVLAAFFVLPHSPAEEARELTATTEATAPAVAA